MPVCKCTPAVSDPKTDDIVKISDVKVEISDGKVEISDIIVTSK